MTNYPENYKYIRILEDWGFKLTATNDIFISFKKDIFTFTIFTHTKNSRLELNGKIIKTGDFQTVLEKYVDCYIQQTLVSEEINKDFKMLLTTGRLYKKNGKAITNYKELMETINNLDEEFANSINNA